MRCVATRREKERDAVSSPRPQSGKSATCTVHAAPVQPRVRVLRFNEKPTAPVFRGPVTYGRTGTGDVLHSDRQRRWLLRWSAHVGGARPKPFTGGTGRECQPGRGVSGAHSRRVPLLGFLSWPLWPPPSLQRLHAQPRFPTAARSQLSMRCAIASAPSFAQPRGYVAHRLRWMLSREVPLLVGCVVCVYGVFGGSAATGGPRARISGAEELDRRRHNVHRVRLTARQRGRAGVGAGRPRRTAKRGIGIAPARYRRDRRHASMWKDME